MLTALVGGVAVTLPRFLFDSADSIQPMGLAAALILTAVWCLPLWLFVRFSPSTLVAIVGSTVYIIGAALLLAATYRSDHSTAAFGAFFGPFYFAVAVGLVLAAENFVSRFQ